MVKLSRLPLMSMTPLTFITEPWWPSGLEHCIISSIFLVMLEVECSNPCLSFYFRRFQFIVIDLSNLGGGRVRTNLRGRIRFPRRITKLDFQKFWLKSTSHSVVFECAWGCLVKGLFRVSPCLNVRHGFGSQATSIDLKWNHKHWDSTKTWYSGSPPKTEGEHPNIKKLSTCTSSTCYNAHSLLSMEIWDVIQIYLRSKCVPTLKK